MDFTLEKYEELCLSLIESNYEILTVYSYLQNKSNLINRKKFAILRHDVDRLPGHALKMAKLEKKLGIQSTYYFRFPYTFRPEIIKKIYNMDHEVGYHYEVLTKARGDFKKAIELFEYELNKFRKLVEVKTICMHGAPLYRYDNRDLWKKYNFRDFGIVGEAYLSVDNLNYFSDTGRTWSWKSKGRDRLPNINSTIEICKTDELISLVKKQELKNVYILVHPERWSSNITEWFFDYGRDIVFNIGRRVISWIY